MSRKSLLIRGIATAVVVSAALVLTGCSTGADTPEAVEFTSVTAALTAEPESLDPLLDPGLASLTITGQVFDALTHIDKDGKATAQLAESWTSNADLTEWVYELRKDAKFTNGDPVTADDVIFSYDLAKNGTGSRLASYVTRIDSVTKTGDYEITFKLLAPYAPFATQTVAVPIFPEAAYKADAASFATNPIGSGPYMVKEWKKGVSIELTRNDDYWGEKGSVETVTYLPVADDTARSNSILSGDLDVALLAPTQLAAVKASTTADVVTESSNRVLYLGMNQKTNSWLADADVREAMSLAVDRASLATGLYGATVTPANQLIAPSVQGFDPNAKDLAFDVDKAKKLVKGSGYDGTPIVLSYPTTGLPQISELAQAVASSLEDIGLTVTLDGQEAGTFTGSWFAGTLPGAYIFAFAPGTMDADLPNLLLAKSGHTGSFSDADLDALMDAQIGEADPAARVDDFAKINDIIRENTYYAPLFVDSYSYGVTKGLTWKPQPNGFVFF